MTIAVRRELASLFSSALFRAIMTREKVDRADNLVRVLRIACGLEQGVSNSQVIDAAYALLLREHRIEYFYRNAVTNKLLIGRHKTTGAALINEFRIADSVVDCALFNGKAIAYEIKTEFDYPARLDSQLASYYRAFKIVNVIASASSAAYYQELLKDTPVGLVNVSDRNSLTVVKAARETVESLDTHTMFRSLRLGEAKSVLSSHWGALPSWPNGLEYRRLRDIAQDISPVVFHDYWNAVLRRRRLRNSAIFLAKETPGPLKAIVAHLDPNVVQQQRLTQWLTNRGESDVLSVCAR